MTASNGRVEWRGDIRSGSGQVVVENCLRTSVLLRKPLQRGRGNQSGGVDRGCVRRLLHHGTFKQQRGAGTSRNR